MRFPRASGILLHISSLPSPFGIGDVGPSSVQFVDFLKNAGQTIWQILPLNPPAHGSSPYSCYSVFAGNALLISPQSLVDDGWLSNLAVVPRPSQFANQATRVEFDAASTFKQAVLRRAFAESKQALSSNLSYVAYCSSNAWWLDEFARFESLMWHFETSDWSTWPADLVHRDAATLTEWDERLAESIQFSKFIQYVFDQQWQRLKHYANDREIRTYGDMPIFVARESADVWANQSLFHLNDDGSPTLVAGVPPDYFSETGQLWGNPLYRWDVMEANDFAWWTSRFRRALAQFDLLRVDHFRGFESYWEIPADAATAQSGQWRPGPGAKPFQAARAALGDLPIIAEDLGMITQAVHDLRDELDFPPMRVMQFGYETEEDDFHRPSHYPEHSVAYTGTHDNDTLMGWLNERRSRHPDDDLLKITTQEDVHWELIQMVLDSAADTAIIPMQDILGLGNEARMNVPGEADGNWAWRVRASDITESLAARLKAMTERANR